LKEEVSTSKAGRYASEITLPAGSLPAGKVELEALKPSFKTSDKIQVEKVVKEKVDKKGNTYYLAH
jgi:hypothetical protein